MPPRPVVGNRSGNNAVLFHPKRSVFHQLPHCADGLMAMFCVNHGKCQVQASLKSDQSSRADRRHPAKQ
jgi:hypothetical protein